MTQTNIASLNDLRNPQDNSYSFIAPSGKIITLPSRTKMVWFSTYDRFFKKVDEKSVPTSFSPPIGSLIAFDIGDTTYSVIADGTGTNFVGYQNQAKKGDFYIDKLTFKDKPQKGIILLTSVENNQFIGYAGLFTPSNSEITANGLGAGTLQTSLFACPLSITDLASSPADYFAQKTQKTIRVTDAKYLVQNDFSIVNISPPMQATDYLKTVLDQNSFLADVLVQFAMVYQNPENIALLSNCNEQNKVEANKLVITEFNRQLNNILTGNGQADRNTMENLASAFLAASYKSFNQLQGANTLKDILNNTSTTDEVWAKLQLFNSDCTFSALDADTRIKLLDWLFTNDNNYWKINDRTLIYPILATTPDDQMVGILKAFMNKNYKWLYTLWDQDYKEDRGKAVDFLAEQVSRYFDQLKITPTSKSINMLDLGIYNDVPEAEVPFCIGLEENTPVCTENNFKLVRTEYDKAPDATFNEDGKIEFVQDYTLQEITTYVMAAGSVDTRKSYKEHVDYSLQPFEPVTVYFARDYAPIGVVARRAYIVPAIWAIRMAEAASDVETAEFEENLRTAANQVAIILIPFTGPGSSVFTTFMMRLGQATALADQIISANKVKDPALTEFYNDWDNFYYSVTLAEGVTAIASIAKISTISRTFAKLDETVNARWGNLTAKTQEAWNGLKALKSAVGVEDVAKAGDDLIDIAEITPKLKTQPNTAFFWSGRTSKGISVQQDAVKLAESKGGTTLEMLLEERNIQLPVWDANDPKVVKIWEDVSSEYAKQVSGEVRVILGKQLREGNVWQTKELPALKDNINVTKIITIDPETLVETVIFTR